MNQRDDDAPTRRPDQDEAQMRRALGLEPAGAGAAASAGSFHHRQSAQDGASARPRSRFVQDGQVPVTMLRRQGGSPDQSGAQARVRELEQALATERAARVAAEHALADAQAQAKEHQTRRAHAEFARDEAQASAKALQTLLDAHLAAIPGSTPQDATPSTIRVRSAEPQPGDAPKRPRGRPPGSGKKTAPAPPAATAVPTAAAAEQKPVKWWLGGGLTGRRKPR